MRLEQRLGRWSPRVATCLASTILATSTILASSCASGDADHSPQTASLRITRDFGRTALAIHETVPLPARATMLQTLRDNHRVRVRTDRGWPLSIDGLSVYNRGESETTWALNVNGIEADEAPRDYRVHAGDVIQWDYRDWYVTLDVRATVGAFPETFTRGVFGRRFPITVECADSAALACKRVMQRLRRAGVATDGSLPPGPRPPRGEVQRARILVGPWKRWRGRAWPRRIDEGARYSGVFAKFNRSANRIRLLDWDGRTVRAVGAGSGLVAAQRPTEEDLLWVVTGVDDEGVERAARALGSPNLRDAFALVVTPRDLVKVPVPLADSDRPREREG